MTAFERITKVLIVDDSAFFCAALEKELSKFPKIKVVGTAGNPYEARDKILQLRPDILTLDVEMPKMDGIKFLWKLIPQYPIPCVVVTSIKEYEEEALKAGAVDFVTKPRDGETLESFASRLAAKLTAAAKVRVVPKKAVTVRRNIIARKPVQTGIFSDRIIALGASTGGTDALESVLKEFPEDCPPIVIVQHMPPVFTKMYAERLDKSCRMHVIEASDGDRLKQGLCIIAAGDKHMRLKKDVNGYYVSCAEEPKVSGHCPSVDVLFESVAEAAGKDAVAAILTGMGADGAKGMKKLHDSGAYTIGQDKDSCVVYGMPMEAYNLGAVDEQLPLDRIGQALLYHCH